MTTPPRRAGNAIRRTGRLLLGRNELRRMSDRIEGAVVVVLSAAFLIACVAAALFARHLYQSEYQSEHAAARLRPAVAALSRPVMVGRSGEPLAPRPSPGDLLVNALFVDVIVTMGAGVVLILCYLVCRRALDRRRLARWESAWAAVGPRWTRRR